MKNGQFVVDTKKGVIACSQKAHGRMYVSSSEVHDEDKFNIGVGQLIAMKRNEIEIRKDDIAEMRDLACVLEGVMDSFGPGAANKQSMNQRKELLKKIDESLNHIRELNRDIKQLSNGTYEHLPEDVKNGTKIYAFVDGSVKLVENIYNY